MAEQVEKEIPQSNGTDLEQSSKEEHADGAHHVPTHTENIIDPQMHRETDIDPGEIQTKTTELKNDPINDIRSPSELRGMDGDHLPYIVQSESPNHQSDESVTNQTNAAETDTPMEKEKTNNLRETLDQLKSRIESAQEEQPPQQSNNHNLPAISYYIKPAKAEIARIPSPPPYIKEHLSKFKQSRQISMVNYTPRLMRITTVPVNTRPKANIFPNNVYYERPRKPHKTVTLEEAFTSRPPLRTDMDGPGPWSYSPQNKPLRETNSPMWSFGRKCCVEKEGGSRTSWTKTWFQNPHIWSQKTDFHSDRKWSSPNSYNIKPTCGIRHQTMLSFPSFTIGVRDDSSFVKPGADSEPSPNEYQREKSDTSTLRRSPSYTQRMRHGGTVLWQQPEVTPGPGSYNTSYEAIHRHQPAFTIRGIRKPNVHNLGPFASF